MNLLEWLFYDKEASEVEKRNRERAASLTKEARLAGKIDQETYQARMKEIGAPLVYDSFYASGKITDGFADGLKEGVNNIKVVTNSIADNAFKVVPWQVWFVLGVIGVIYLLPYVAKRNS